MDRLPDELVGCIVEFMDTGMEVVLLNRGMLENTYVADQVVKKARPSATFCARLKYYKRRGIYKPDWITFKLRTPSLPLLIRFVEEGTPVRIARHRCLST